MLILSKKRRIRNTGYNLPDIFRSFEDFQRVSNLDLTDLENFSLRQELFRLKQAKAYINPQRQEWLFLGPGKFVSALDWLQEREAVVRAELRRRRTEHDIR